MSLTPVEIAMSDRSAPARLRASWGVDRLLDDIASSYEDVWRDRAIQATSSSGSSESTASARSRTRFEHASAERMADELRARAHQEADLIVEEARAKAREIAASAEADEQRVRDEIRRLRALEADVRAEFRAFLASALERLEGELVGYPDEAPRLATPTDPSEAVDRGIYSVSGYRAFPQAPPRRA